MTEAFSLIGIEDLPALRCSIITLFNRIDGNEIDMAVQTAHKAAQRFGVCLGVVDAVHKTVPVALWRT